ncbi:MAG: DUF502 domain-containing protein [Candidatus Omnitrophica bacterium]|nr:DUF502 domain-containing protein [Candidatus Omnitrophota bacterium]
MKKVFLTGLAAIVPVVITVYVITGLFNFADGILGKYINDYAKDYLGVAIPGLGIIISILIIFVVGSFIRLFGNRLLRWIETMFFRLPLVNKIYFPIKRIVEFLFFPPRKTFETAVLLQYPRKGIYSLGFVTSESSTLLREKTRKKLYNVFISSSPYPLTGFTVVVPEEELTFLNISVEKAMKMVVSGGLINLDN